MQRTVSMDVSSLATKRLSPTFQLTKNRTRHEEKNLITVFRFMNKHFLRLPETGLYENANAKRVVVK